ncbi:MAG: hypothetical protein WCF19_05170 [Chlamydiales bacterium]
MVNNSDPVPPSGNSPKGVQQPGSAPPKNTGSFEFKEGHHFLGMDFTAKDWTKLMNIFLNNLNGYISKTFQKMTEKMKKDWKRGAGEDDGDS